MIEGKRPTVNQPVPGFDVADLFMSRTDERGVIQSGNGVFQRLAGYDWETLIGAPQRLIRHPDMPKMPFWLLWQTIHRGQPFGAYVKNRAACGRYYWVFAIVSPVEGGYLSVRLKPTSDLFDKMKEVYARLLADERDAGFDPGRAGHLLQAELRELGFRDYSDFTSCALGAEFDARSKALGRPLNAGFARFEEIDGLIHEMSDDVRRLERLFAQISRMPANLRLLGARFEKAGDPVQVIAQNYETISGQLHDAVIQVSQSLTSLIGTASRGRMAHCSSLLFAEAIPLFEEERISLSAAEQDREMQILRQAWQQFELDMSDGYSQIRKQAIRFADVAHHLRKMLSGLSVTRVICSIEAASLPGDTSGIDEVTRHLGEFQEELQKALDRISRASERIVRQVAAAMARA